MFPRTMFGDANQRSLENLPIALKRADDSILFDNSTSDGYRLVAILGSTGNRRFEPKPSWAAGAELMKFLRSAPKAAPETDDQF
jgi:predicted ABC-type ATPase